jgi:hypothetical protein
MNQQQTMDQTPQFFVPGGDQGPSLGQPAPGFQQGFQPPQPHMNQLTNQMGAMNVGPGYGYSNQAASV